MITYDAKTEKVLPEVNRAHVLANPFETRKVTYEWKPGETVREILDNIDPDLATPRTVVAIDGHTVKSEYFHVLRPKAGTLITVHATPGGRNLFRTVAMIAVVVGATILGGPAGGALAQTFGGSLAVWTAVSQAIIMTVGMLAINHFLPIQTNVNDYGDISTSQSLAIGASRNPINPFGVTPMLLGYMRIYPPMAGLPYTTYDGINQVVHMIFHLTYKDAKFWKSTAKLGDTLLSTLGNYELELGSGEPDDEEITAYRRKQFDQQVNKELSVSGTAGAIIETTTAGTRKVKIDLFWLNGLIFIENDGDLESLSVGITTDYRLSGSGDPWTIGNPEFTTTARSRDVIRVTKRIKFPTPGIYEVRVWWSNENWSQDNIPPCNGCYESDYVSEAGTGFNVPTWTYLRSIQTGETINNPEAAVAALELVATDQLTGNPDTFNIEGQSKLPDWNGVDSWDTIKTSNPASLLRSVFLKDSVNARAIAAARLNGPSFEAFHDWCVLMEFTFNMYIDYAATVNDVINMISASGRARCFPIDGLWTVIIDKRNDVISQYLSPRNTNSYQASRIYPEDVHAFRVRFPSNLEGWVPSQQTIYKEGYNADGTDGNTIATKFEALDLPGVTDPYQIWKLGKYYMNCSEVQQEQFAINLDVENLVSLPGDRIAWQEESILIGLGAARIADWSDPVITVDSALNYSNDSYAMTIRHSNATATTVTVDPLDGAPNGAPSARWTITGGDVTTSIVEGDLVLFGISGGLVTQDLLIKDLIPGPNLTANLVCVPYSLGCYPEENGQSPPVYDPVITPPVTPGKPATIVGSSDEYQTGLLVTWTADGPIDTVDQIILQYRLYIGPENDGEYTRVVLPGTDTSYRIEEALAGESYEIKVQYVYFNGQYSPILTSTVASVAVPVTLLTEDLRVLTTESGQPLGV